MSSDMEKESVSEKLKHYKFEFRHLSVLLIILLIFQFAIFFIQKNSLHKFLNQTQDWYQKDTAERIANLSTISLELILENIYANEKLSHIEERRIIQSFNIILSQQFLQQNVQEICLIIQKDNKYYVADNGKLLFDIITNSSIKNDDIINSHKNALDFYLKNENKIKGLEQVFSVLESTNTFHIFVPLVPHGEYLGVLYMKNTPNFSFITNEIITGYNEASVIYSTLILLGLLAMYGISSNTLKERNEVQIKLFEEQKKFLKEQIVHEKESLFTKRIYHTYHKSEKVMGFIKEDLKSLTIKNIDEIKYRTNKYANFISRVIYDMKWYEPPANTIRNPIYKSNLNEIIKFIIQNIFLRITSINNSINFETNLDENIPIININEFVIWEILEPIMQNSIDHSDKEKIYIKVETKFDSENKQSLIIISDNGPGIKNELLETNENGVKKIFLEKNLEENNISKHRGYGCYIVFELVKRCGWKINVSNLPDYGCQFIIYIKHNNGKLV
ncbi:MAG: hypothetical protein STSR0008_08070 [Ignavibacterium sp.]